jgi:hypothetical protein
LLDFAVGYSYDAFETHHHLGRLLTTYERKFKDWGVVYPFLVVKFDDRDSIEPGNDPAIENSRIYVDLVEHLNRQLGDNPGSDAALRMNNAVLTFVINRMVANLYVSWKDDGEGVTCCKVQNVENLLLGIEESHGQFRKYFQNIVDWGKTERLKEAQECINVLVERYRKASEIDLISPRSWEIAPLCAITPVQHAGDPKLENEDPYVKWPEWEKTVARWFYWDVDGNLRSKTANDCGSKL